MLSIGAMGGTGAYYLQLAREDYYLEGGEPLGRWWGRGAEKLGLKGTVKNDQLKALLKGYSPDGKKLVQNAGSKDHQTGWDLTFSAPKSVSVLWSQADQDIQREIQAAHAEAVKAALKFLQEEVLYTRRGKGGVTQEPIAAIVATFEHGTSREMDPQLHTHALLLNVGIREDGTTGTILSKPVYQAKMIAGALYRAELAAQLERRCQVLCEREERGDSFRVVGVDTKLCNELSKRRDQIKEKLKSRGAESAAAASAAAYETRRTKEDVPPRSELFASWKKVAETFGFDADRVLGQQTKTRNPAKEQRAAIDESLKQITESHGHFTERELLRRAAINAQGRGIDADAIRQSVRKALETRADIIKLGEHEGQERFTTQQILDAEKKLIGAAERLDKNKKHGAGQKTIDRVLRESGRHLTDEQKEAVRYLTKQEGGALRSLEGLAGTGKTSTLSIAREILERQGYQVIGTTLAAKAAKELEKGAQIHSGTIALLNILMEKPGAMDVLKHEARQLGRAMLGKDRFDMFAPQSFNKKTVLVIDEAGMVATPDLAKLAEAVAKAGGMLITTFDRTQLQAIGPGGGAAHLADRFGKAELADIVRQHEEWMRDAVRQFSRGDAAGALKQYALAGKLHVEADREKAISSLVSDWAKNEQSRRDGSLIFVGTRDEVFEVNRRCQEARLKQAEIRGSSHNAGEYELYRGDRVLFTKNSGKIGVRNGDLGTIESFIPAVNIASVKLDSGDYVLVPLHTYKDVQLGYAVTTHKGQGTTVDNAYLLVGGHMQDRHLSCVQASRAREQTHIYTDRHEAGDKLAELAKQMSKEREKTLAHEVMKRAKQAEQERASQTLKHQRGMRI